MDSLIEQLKQLFRQGSVIRKGGLPGEQNMYFEGHMEQHTGGANELQNMLGATVDPLLLDFLAVFGGTRLFVSQYGTGTTVFTFREILDNSHRLYNELIADRFWPHVFVVAEDAVGDLLCLYKEENGRWHFGNFHHECCGENLEEWLEGFIPAHFNQWLDNFIETRGITLPGDNISYKLGATINYILPEKAHLHLKLGRKLAVFVKTGKWFESKTFEWIGIEGKSAPYTATYIKTYDEGSEYLGEVLDFRRVFYNDADLQENSITGSLEDCMHWIANKLDGTGIRLMKQEDLKIVYLDLLRKKLLGRDSL